MSSISKGIDQAALDTAYNNLLAEPDHAALMDR